MEDVLRSHMMQCADAMIATGRRSLTSLGLDVLGDRAFFSRVRSGRNFTVRTYDRVMLWFSENWPDDAEWPSAVPRPLPPPPGGETLQADTAPPSSAQGGGAPFDSEAMR